MLHLLCGFVLLRTSFRLLSVAVHFSSNLKSDQIPMQAHVMCICPLLMPCLFKANSVDLGRASAWRSDDRNEQEVRTDEDIGDGTQMDDG